MFFFILMLINANRSHDEAFPQGYNRIGYAIETPGTQHTSSYDNVVVLVMLARWFIEFGATVRSGHKMPTAL
jgi:hypothetical protein